MTPGEALAKRLEAQTSEDKESAEKEFKVANESWAAQATVDLPNTKITINGVAYSNGKRVNP